MKSTRKLRQHNRHSTPTLMIQTTKTSSRLWYGPAIGLASFLVAFAAVIYLFNQSAGEARLSELQDRLVSVSDSISRRLDGNADYLALLAKSRAEGSLTPAQFQQRAGDYVLGHPELINITWVDADFFIRDVAPLAANRQIVGLHLDLPEPKRASQLARQTRRPVYTAPFEAIQGNPSFEVWVPVFAGDRFLGLFAGVYSCDRTLQQLVPPQVRTGYQASLLGATGLVLAELPRSHPVAGSLVRQAPLTPGGGVRLQLAAYGTGPLGWALVALELLCLALALGTAYAMWGLKREVTARKLAEEDLHQKTVLLGEELIERQLSQEALQEQTAILEEEIEERSRVEESLRESEARYRVLIEQAPDAIVVYDLDLGRLVDANASAEALFGCSRFELLQSDPTRFYRAPQPDARPVSESFEDHNAQAIGGKQVQFERAIRTADGRDLVCMVRLTRLPSDSRRLLRGSFVDVTNQKLLEENLRSQTVRLEQELAERQVAQAALQGQATLLREEVEERRRVEEALTKSEATVRHKLQAILEPTGDIGTLELSDIIDVEVLQSMLDDFYRLSGILGAVLDVSGKVLVSVGWQDICTKFHRCHPETRKNCVESDTALTRDVPPGTFKMYRCKNNMWDMVTPVVVGGRHVGNVFIGQFFYQDEEPDVAVFREQARRYGFDEAEYLAALDRVPRFSRETVQAGMRFYSQLASVLSTLSFSSIQLSRMLAERSRLEEQLRQSQKMEAVGQLAGGVAHDFNNLLQVITGYGQLIQMGERLDARQSGYLEQILSSTAKAAQLTQGLLAFSRKQVMAFAPVDLNDIVQQVRIMLARIIGEDIQLATNTCDTPLTIYADRGQVEQVLINLATNARDAMPNGGRLTLETGFELVEPPVEQNQGVAQAQLHAVLTVSDTGCGMDEETCKRVYEPFYTTKEVGKGTGLGMAIVYGIVKQHNGLISVASQSGQGTVFRVYLPLHQAERPEQPGPPVLPEFPEGGQETILLAEDDAGVRELTVAILTKYGYRVIEAVDGQDAVEKFALNRARIHLILMDVIMPRKSGKEAYEEISLLQPGVKVLFSSGYPADYIEGRGVSGAAIELIMKPVQPLDLLRKVRGMLDA